MASLVSQITGVASTDGKVQRNHGEFARQFRFSAAPSSGTWRAGDVVWDDTPSASGSIGWVGVTAGTPGTWKSFGTISA